MMKRVARRLCSTLALFLLLSASARAQTEPPYPHLVNVYLSGEVDDATIAALSRWDAVVLNESWTPAQLERLRSLNPKIKIFVYVLAYEVSRQPATRWSGINLSYVTAEDLWWYDSDGRIASDWYGTGMVNVTSLAPQGALGSWRHFWVEHVVGLVLERPQLDGVYLDNFWRQISWQQQHRRLDSDCNPTHNPSGCDGVPDSPERLDALWHEGLTAIATELRQRFDDIEAYRTRPLALISNAASDYFQWLNGTLYEYFPSGYAGVDYDNPYGYNWNREMWDDIAGYAAAPFRTQPYPFSILNTEAWGSRWEPLRTPSFERHKRFTFVSSLLGSGYYSLDAGHNGNANLWWEPEYDNAGRGKGYLGQPLGPPYRLLAPEGPEVLANPDFSLGTTGWLGMGFSAQGTLRADATSFHSAPQSLRIDVQRVTSPGMFKVWQHPVALAQHEAYTLSFWARGSGEIVVQLYGDGCENQTCWGPRRLRLQPTWRRFDTSFHANGNSAAGLDFLVEAPGSVWLDDVSLRRGDTALFRRDFENGIVLLNYTNMTRFVPLGGRFRRLQVPGSDVFDGSFVTSEYVTPSDARILLRRSPTDAAEGDLVAAPARTLLAPNRPNPFNPQTEIHYTLETGGPVRLAVYDVAGRLVRVLVDGEEKSGLEHVTRWDGRDSEGSEAASGVYVLRLTTPGFTTARKMVLSR